MEGVIHQTRKLRTRITQRAHDAFFSRVHGNSLVYNACWEDPRLDREMLNLDSESRLVMITSAGCNALDYLLDNPAHIHAVDMNPRQNALLQLKAALLKHGDPEELFAVFGRGVRPGFSELLKKLEAHLPPYALRFWGEKQKYFESSALNPSFYYRGTSGQVAWVVMKSLLQGHPRMRDLVENLFAARTLEDQRAIYELIQPALWNAFNSWLVQQPVTMTMLGVPRPQIRLIETQFPGGLKGFVRNKVEHVLKDLPIQDNYFWRAYAMGSYTHDCCPNYLRAEHSEILRHRISRVTPHTATIANFLRENPASYSHYVLLDHQDWLAAHNTAALAEEWDLILQNSRPGTRILLRSAGVRVDFIPAHVLERLELDPETADRLHPLDRVGTYGCTFLATVK
jgi:S-adenosylmethionine-diacylglycerol 3-amino-3-carboxypropyl transferase